MSFLEKELSIAQEKGWTKTPVKTFLREVNLKTEIGTEELLGLSKKNGVLRKKDFEQRSSEAMSYIGYKKVKAGQLISNKMQAWNGMFGISAIDGITSPDYAIYDFSSDIEPRFIEYIVRTNLYAGEFLCRSRGMGTGFLRLNPSEFLSTHVWLPGITIQKEIVDFLDRETDLINQLIEKKQIFLLKTSERISSLIDKAISCKDVPRIRFENVVQRMQRTVNLSEYDELIRLGLYNRGRGIFKKPEADEEGMGDSKFFFVEPGDLILSGQFAWEGAVALATSKEKGCVVSHRYPIYRGKGSLSTSYLFGLLRSNFGDFILNEASRGSAGRNRPLNTWRLGKEKIPIPNISLQEEVEQAVIFERDLRENTQRTIDTLEEFRASLITEAVTGQLDIKLWEKRGNTDKRLDNIEEAMRT